MKVNSGICAITEDAALPGSNKEVVKQGIFFFINSIKKLLTHELQFPEFRFSSEI
jgi:hypothetical protein